ncbi:TolC family protein [Aquabacterium sp.]|uniref:TolC family protein n=1 Tax=Aquabacterium sp. TaxID=1872578 RepID=UPI003BB20448
MPRSVPFPCSAFISGLNRITVAASLMVCGFSNIVSAAPLTLTDAFGLVIKNHPVIAAKRDEFQAAQHGVDGAKWQRFPSLSGQSSANNESGSVTTLRLEQPLWTGGRITAAIQSSEAKLAAAAAAVEEAEQSMLLRVATNFLELVRLNARMEAAEENIAEHERLLALIERRSAQGIGSPSEVITAKARLQRARSERLQLQTAAFNARADLSQATGTTVSEIRVPKPDLNTTGDLTTMVQKVLDHSPQMRRLHAETSSITADVQLKKSALNPQIAVRHEFLKGKNYPSTATYLALTLQTGNGLSSISAIDEVRAQESASAYKEQATLKDISDSIRTDWNKVQSAREEAAILRELVSVTRSMYESYVRQYAAGRKSWLDVLNARSESIQARYSLIDTEWSGALSAIKLQIAAGELTGASADDVRNQAEQH